MKVVDALKHQFQVTVSLHVKGACAIGYMAQLSLGQVYSHSLNESDHICLFPACFYVEMHKKRIPTAVYALGSFGTFTSDDDHEAFHSCSSQPFFRVGML